jgi:hypothetical protein
MMKTSAQRHHWLIDASLFAGFLAAFFLDLTGHSFHQWLGIALGVITGYHLLSHWTWVKAVSQRFIGRTSNQARLYFLVDASLLLGLLLILGTGLVISTWLTLTLENYDVWKDIHVYASVITLFLVNIKIGIHWRWILRAARRNFAYPAKPIPEKKLVQPAPVRVNNDRREFLKLMGVVGFASVIAMSKALDTFTKNGSVETLGLSTSQINLSDAGSVGNSASRGCVQRCNRGCSYPGHCHRYVDTNQNNLCDLGECI